MQITLKFLYSLSLTFWIGSIFFFSMFAAPSIFKVLSREQAGNVVSDIFPKYYLVSYACGAVALISSIILIYIGNHFSHLTNIIKLTALVVMIGLAVYAGEIVTPETHKVRTEMRSVQENSHQYQEIRKEFGRLHRKSAILNSAIFIFGVALVFINAYTNSE
ncbi:MAG: DUF4149 domain-containing protein [Candidatus Dadabacteria bacterium]|nr:MAG: DUF4149 domain-containing protein [Candidatus Dadabacteria bacterium]TDJ02966.1 MAG: DUF4149 domain-containing protein [Candidatus Dadabacteria bacterium]